MSLCQSIPGSDGFISSMLRWSDCQADAFALGSWQAFSAPGSTLSLVLSAFLTIFVALFGYQLLLGRTLNLQNGTLAMVKIGAVLALATSWPVYRTLVYDIIVEAPAQLFSEMGSRSIADPADSMLLRRLDASDDAINRLRILGPGYPQMINSDQQLQQPPPPFAGFDAFALGTARMVFLLTSLASLGAVRLVAALTLALGPVLVAFLLFDSTRSLFEGWVRVTAGAALAGLGARLALTLQLNLLEPWLADVIARRQANQFVPAASTELLVIVGFFALCALALVLASARITRYFRMAPLVRMVETFVKQRMNEPAVLRNSDRHTPQLERASVSSQANVRVSGIAQSVQERERLWSARLDRGAMPASNRIQGGTEVLSSTGVLQIGQTFRRTAKRRSVAGSAKRDARS